MGERSGRSLWLLAISVAYPALLVAGFLLVDPPIRLYAWSPAFMVFGLPLLLLAAVPLLDHLGFRFHWLPLLLFTLWIGGLALVQLILVSLLLAGTR